MPAIWTKIVSTHLRLITPLEFRKNVNPFRGILGKKERFLRVFRCVITTFSITAQQPVQISTSGQALVKLGPL